jgi:hypothetical protein
MFGEQGRKQHVAALRASRKPDLSGLRSEGADVVREHGEASSAAAADFPSEVPLTKIMRRENGRRMNLS